MNAPLHRHRFRPVRLNFTWKIILIAITLLAVSQILGTLISVSTFETLLLKTLTAKYEILGKDLKRRIQHSLKFGKRLDNFIGMEKLIKPVYAQAKDVDEILIFDLQGRLFFASKRKELSRSDNSPQSSLDENVFLVDSAKTQIDLPAHYFSSLNETTPKIQLYKKKYYALFTIPPFLNSKQGMLALTFKQSVLDRQTYKLMKSAGSKLLLSLVLTAMIMGIMIHLFFTRPSREQAHHFIRNITTRAEHKKMSAPSGQDDMRHVYDMILRFQAAILEAETTLSHTLHDISELTPNEKTLSLLHQMQLELKGKQDEID